MAISREEWLGKAIDKLRPLFEEAGTVLPDKIRVGIGFPGGRGPKKEVIGQCWYSTAVADGVPTIFISPVHNDPVKTLITLVHELVHAVGREGHRREFSELASKVGLEKPWRSTPPSDALQEALGVLAGELGEFDHGTITPANRPNIQTTRLLKVQCPICGYTARITRKWIDTGLPSCPDGDEMEES